MNQKIHQQVQEWLESDHPLDAQTEAALHEHLRVCVDCRNYARLLTQLDAGKWNPRAQRPLTATESHKIINQILPQVQLNRWLPSFDFFSLSSALGFVGLLVMVGLFALAISQVRETAVPPAALPQTENYVQYDGWETGVAFQFPASWTLTDFEVDNGTILTFATPLDETAAACVPYFEAGQSAAAWSIPRDESQPLTPLEFLTRFLESDEITPLEAPETVTVNGRSAAYTVGQIPCEGPFDQMTIMTTETQTHHLLFGLRHDAESASAAKNELEAIITSLAEVDYAGWQPWQPEGFTFTVMTPDNWNAFDALKSLQLTTSSQPMWSSYADPNPQPQPNPADMNLFHNLNRQVGDTPQAAVENLIAQMEAELTMQQVEPPTAHPFIPGLVTAVYTTEDTAIFFGALAYPRNTVSLDPIGALATVPLDQLDSFGTTFERVLRSLNGYYLGSEDLPIRNTIRGGEYMPTPTPIPQPTEP